MNTAITVAGSEVHPLTVCVKLMVYIPTVVLVMLLFAVVPDIDPAPNVAAVEFTDHITVAPDMIVAVKVDDAPVQTGLTDNDNGGAAGKGVIVATTPKDTGL